MSRARAASAAPRIGGLVEFIDRFFPLVWIGIYLLLPVSGWATVMFDSWFDQQRDLEALRSVLADGHADAIADNVIGPAYIAAAGLLHSVLGLSPEDSLVALTRGSYALSVAVGMVLVRVSIKGLASAPPLVTLASQFVFMALVFSAGTWHWSDVPWSHFFAAFLAVTLYAVRFAASRPTVIQAGAIGLVIGLLALTRSFELAALVLAWAIVLVGFAALRLSGPRTWRAAHLATGVGAFVVTTAAVYLATGKRDVFLLYGNYLDRQSGNVLAAEVAKTPTFDFGLIPVKLVQLFVEPCYYSLCSLGDYAGGASPLPLPLAGAAGNERLWRLPLSIQLPALVLLPLCLVALVVICAWFVKNRALASAKERQLRLLAEMTIAATGIVVGYAASTMTGSSHLRYGFARDFLLPALLTGVVGVSLVSIGLWVALSRLGRRALVSPASLFVVLAVVASAGLVAGTSYARSHGLPRIESRQLGDVSYSARCRDGNCAVSIAARTRSGRPISIREASTLTFGCGDDRPRFTLYAERPSAGVRLVEACPNPRLVAAWPVVMGLPPGSYELGAVSVENP